MNTDIHFYHIMKTGGRSLIRSFISDASGITDIDKIDIIYKGSCTGDIIEPLYKYIISGHGSEGVFNREKLVFSASHHPFVYFKKRLPKNVFTMTILRHPYDRLLSLYKEALRQRDGSLLGDRSNFYEYVKSIYNDYPAYSSLHNFFGKNFDEAINNIKTVSYIMFIDTYESDLNELNKIIDTDLKMFQSGTATNTVDISIDDKQKVEDFIKDDIKFYNEVKSWKI